MIEVLATGLYSSIQDMGRCGYRAYGVPVAGAMDIQSLQLGNLLAGNSPHTAALEITLIGPKLHFSAPALIVLSGADLSATVNGRRLLTHRPELIQRGETLSFGRAQYGCRAYLCIKGGFDVPQVFNSASTYAPAGLGLPVLTKGMRLHFTPYENVAPNTGSRTRPSSALFESEVLEAYQGPEFDNAKVEFLHSVFTVSQQSNRMGYRLDTANDFSHSHSILTSAVQPGTVQLPPSGKPVVLMKDCQTTGGYPRILQLTEQAICILAQKKPGDTVRFALKA